MTWNADGDEFVENPPITGVNDPTRTAILSLAAGGTEDTYTLVDANGNPFATREYGVQLLQDETAIHEVGHAVGIDLHTQDDTCAMNSDSNNWDRGGHFSDLARSLILIHNKTNFGP